MNWQSVEAACHDLKAAKRDVVRAGSGSPIKKLRSLFPTKEAAERATKAALDEAQRGDTTLSLTIMGDATIAAGGRIVVTGIRLGGDGLWSVTSVTHTIAGEGFTTSIEAEIPAA